MAAKLRRYTISLLCAILCWALVITPCLCIFNNSFASVDNAFAIAPGGTLAVVPVDKFSTPPSISQDVFDGSDVVVDDIQDLATTDKVLAGIGAGTSGNQIPSKPATPNIQNPSYVTSPNQNVVVPPQVNEKDVTYTLLTQPNGKSFIYYEQTWPAYASYPYGYTTVGSSGCGPTSMAMVISNLTGVTVSPKYMADWAVKNGFYVHGAGTAYAIFPVASAQYGLKCSTLYSYQKQEIISALQSGKLLITVVGPGDFTRGRHFLLIRGITADGKLLLADSGNDANCVQAWDYNRVMSQVSNGFFWVFEK